MISLHSECREWGESFILKLERRRERERRSDWKRWVDFANAFLIVWAKHSQKTMSYVSFPFAKSNCQPEHQQHVNCGAWFFWARISVTDVLCDIYYNSSKKGTLGEGTWLIMYMTVQTCLYSSSLQTKENMSNYYIMWFVHVGITVVHGRSRRRESRRSVLICQLSRIFKHQLSVWWQEMLSVHGNTPVVREKRNLQTGSEYVCVAFDCSKAHILHIICSNKWTFH